MCAEANLKLVLNGHSARSVAAAACGGGGVGAEERWQAHGGGCACPCHAAFARQRNSCRTRRGGRRCWVLRVGAARAETPGLARVLGRGGRRLGLEQDWSGEWEAALLLCRSARRGGGAGMRAEAHLN